MRFDLQRMAALSLPTLFMASTFSLCMGCATTKIGTKPESQCPLPETMVPLAVGSSNSTAQDIYKQLYQALLGPAHMLKSPANARRYLAKEWAALGPTRPAEPLIVQIGGSPALVRLNLRPARDARIHQGTVFELMMRSARLVRGREHCMEELLAETVVQLKEHRPDLAGQVRSFAAQQRTAGYPYASHSESYHKAQQPAYRIIVRELAEAELQR